MSISRPMAPDGSGAGARSAARRRTGPGLIADPGAGAGPGPARQSRLPGGPPGDRRGRRCTAAGRPPAQPGTRLRGRGHALCQSDAQSHAHPAL
ncbi:hypothetical protein RirG_022240 [Rhizophagus irregularis DAOM 197198w]|uniref:Uncharacterized protein n=1 Tax=Rhizophagus irregularis (strain DAOM 197198w) TaxID=1432141 RepID=A0A015NE95_RHIIW|nr:hypothetical protein RirG_022240 [Rhizophagus irregularis DAOM 197198w]